MATLTIRNLPDEVRERLRVRAAKRGVSMEAEARTILSGAVAPGGRHAKQSVGDLQEWIAVTRRNADGEDSSVVIRDRRRDLIVEVVRDGRRPRDIFGSNYPRILEEAGWSEDDVSLLDRPNR